jgi:magnesium-transporting ATPase (P-type)
MTDPAERNDLVEVEPPTPQRTEPLNVRSWLTPLTATGIVSVIAFWTAVVVWPFDWEVSNYRHWRIITGVLAACAIGLTVYGSTGSARRRNTMAYITPISAVIAVVLILIMTGSGNLSLEESKRFPIAVGGTALGGLLIGITRYNTIRAAASVTAVVLIIGVLTFPGGREAVGSENVPTIVAWMAVLIGANGASEAIVQATGRKDEGDLHRD